MAGFGPVLRGAVNQCVDDRVATRQLAKSYGLFRSNPIWTGG
ncbi:hypothetical protein [Yoonia sp. BS5-3]|uniref:Transposase n=1 Tax=Yoonia phaeophyticola TaxID=3137369 RepID=A0ABZ2V2Y1_9RHOB